MFRYNLYFQCVVRFFLTPDFQFDRLVVSYVPDVGYVDISASVPIRANAITFDAFHAYMHFQSLEANRIRIHLGDGSLKFALDGTENNYEYHAKDAIVIHSRMAPVTLEGSIPLDITMSRDMAEKAVLRGAGISLTESSSTHVTSVVYSSEFSSFSSVFKSISVQMIGDEASLYTTARPKAEQAESVS